MSAADPFASATDLLDDEASERALVFLHVPKTAGSTLKWIMQRQYPAERTVVIEGEAMHQQYLAFQAQPAQARRRLRCVIGHVPYGIDRWLPQGACYVTMLRHPVAWTLSFRSYLRRMPFFEQHPDFAAFRGASRLGLEGFVDFLARANMLDMQTRALSGEMDAERFLPPYRPLGVDALERAKHSLRAGFASVGVVERFDESLLLMRRKLGWRRIHYRRLNESADGGGRARPAQALVERIVQAHRRDVELYDEACRLLSQQVAAQGEAFQRELRRFRRSNAIYDRLLPLYEASGLQRARRALRRGLQRLG